MFNCKGLYSSMENFQSYSVLKFTKSVRLFKWEQLFGKKTANQKQETLLPKKRPLQINSEVGEQATEQFLNRNNITIVDSEAKELESLKMNYLLIMQ